MFDKNKNECKIDGFVIECDKGFATSKLRRYVENTHNIKFEEYVLKYYYNNEKPKCLCGCGKNTLYHKGKFLKYYGNHYNEMGEHPERRGLKEIRKYNLLENKLKRLGYSVNELKVIYNDFINFKINFTDIEKKYSLDKRTIKKYWRELNFIENEDSFRRITKRHQNYWLNKNGKHGGKKYIDDDILMNIYQYLKEHKNKLTIKEVKRKFDIPETSLVIYKRLCEVFGKKDVDEIIKIGVSSKPEMDYFNILKYYFGDDISKNFMIGRKQYDYILCNKILIEFDGDYWHSLLKKIEGDKIKDKLAIDNNFIIYRVKESESKDLTHLNKLMELYNKYKKK